METNPSLNIYRKLSKMQVEPMQETKGGLLSKTMSTKAKKYKPNVDVTMRVARYIQDIKDYNNA